MNARTLMNFLETVMMGTEIKIDADTDIVDIKYDKVSNTIHLYTKDPTKVVIDKTADSITVTGKLHKCPVCGTLIGPVVVPTKCTYCGYHGSVWISLL